MLRLFLLSEGQIKTRPIEETQLLKNFTFWFRKKEEDELNHINEKLPKKGMSWETGCLTPTYHS